MYTPRGWVVGGRTRWFRGGTEGELDAHDKISRIKKEIADKRNDAA